MQKRNYENDIISLASGRLENYTITKEDYGIIKNMINLCIQNDEVIPCDEADFSKTFVCVEFSEGYAIMYRYNP